jgi:Flp pilus assembly pilin Flp
VGDRGTASFVRPQGRSLRRVLEMVYLRNVLACLRRDCSGSSLIEYSLLITITIVLVVVGVAAVGIWAASMWTNLLPTLPP